ncbi:hypothetical protein [Pararhizobium gei]|nr:hypothetical protein [Rhizobium gei]
MSTRSIETEMIARRQAEESDYRQFMMRELLIWLVGVPVPIAALIGLFVL